MSIQMDTWIDSSNVEQWKNVCRRRLSKGMQGSRAWKAACIIMPVMADVRASYCVTEPSDWVDPPMAPPKLFTYERTDHRHTIYRQISILCWHISIEIPYRKPL